MQKSHIKYLLKDNALVLFIDRMVQTNCLILICMVFPEILHQTINRTRYPRSLLTHERSRSATIYRNFQLRNYGKFSAELSSSAALLIFLTASARTRIVRVDFSCRCRLHRHCCRHKAVRHCSVRLACGKRPYCS